MCIQIERSPVVADPKKIERHTLCGSQGCCPTVEINHERGEVVIADDYGGRVRLTLAQWEAAQKIAT